MVPPRALLLRCYPEKRCWPPGRRSRPPAASLPGCLRLQSDTFGLADRCSQSGTAGRGSRRGRRRGAPTPVSAGRARSRAGASSRRRRVDRPSLPARGRVEDAGMVGEPLVRLVHQPQRRLGIERVAKALGLEVPLPGRRGVRLAGLAADGEHGRVRLGCGRVPPHRRVAEEHDRPRGSVQCLAVELEARAARENDVHLLVAKSLLAVALDHVVAGLLARVGVHPERLDPERAANRLPAQVARHLDRGQLVDAEARPAVAHRIDATGTSTPRRV